MSNAAIRRVLHVVLNYCRREGQEEWISMKHKLHCSKLNQVSDPGRHHETAGRRCHFERSGMLLVIDETRWYGWYCSRRGFDCIHQWRSFPDSQGFVWKISCHTKWTAGHVREMTRLRASPVIELHLCTVQQSKRNEIMFRRSEMWESIQQEWRPSTRSANVGEQLRSNGANHSDVDISTLSIVLRRIWTLPGCMTICNSWYHWQCLEEVVDTKGNDICLCISSTQSTLFSFHTGLTSHHSSYLASHHRTFIWSSKWAPTLRQSSLLVQTAH